MDPALRQTAKGILVTNAYQLSVTHLCFRMGMSIIPATIDRFIEPFYLGKKGLFARIFAAYCLWSAYGGDHGSNRLAKRGLISPFRFGE